jgi:penicillin-binding protein 1A
MTITNAFAESRNIPALKLAARVGIRKVIDTAHRFGVTSTMQPYLPTALGAAEISLEEQVASYSVFPNDGIRVQPRLIRKVSNADGITLWEDPPQVKEVISQQTARTMMMLLQAVTAHGTGAAVAQLHHPLGGKTGTTSDFTDAWFLGFSPSVTCGVWVGYDSRESLGEKETGARAALPIWMAVMKQAILGKDNEQFLGNQDAAKAPLLQAKAAPQTGRAPLPASASGLASRPAGSAGAIRSVPGSVQDAARPGFPAGVIRKPAVPVQRTPAPAEMTPRRPAATPLIKPALPSPAELRRHSPAVKPALPSR